MNPSLSALTEEVYRRTAQLTTSVMLVGVGRARAAKAFMDRGFEVFGRDDFGTQRHRLSPKAVTIYDLMDEETCREVMVMAMTTFGAGAECATCELTIRSPYTGPDTNEIAAFDCVYLDYDFSAQGEYNLGCLWLPAVRAGGVICGSRYGLRRAGCGVSAGVDALRKRFRLQVERLDGKIWLANVPRAVPHERIDTTIHTQRTRLGKS